MKSIYFFFLSIVLLTTISYSPANAQQNPADLDTTFATFRSASYGTAYAYGFMHPLPDGRTLVNGPINHHNSTQAKGLICLDANGNMDPTFIPGITDAPQVMSIAVQTDGKLLITGAFDQYNGVSKHKIVRLHPNGSVDNTFDTGNTFTSFGYVNKVLVQPDGKLMLIGYFTSPVSGTNHHIIRLNSDGSVDPLFNPGTGSFSEPKTMALQPDGKILLAGSILYNDVVLPGIARLNPDGSVDPSFTPGTGASYVLSICLKQDGTIMIGGNFTSYNGTSISRIAHLNNDGTLDPTFIPGTGANSQINALTCLSNGKTIIVGKFTSFNGTNRNKIALINSDGSLDNNFNPQERPYTEVFTVSADEIYSKFLIRATPTVTAGTFGDGYISKINFDGTYDQNFYPIAGASDNVTTMAQQQNGKVLIGGEFTSYNGVVCNKIARINPDGTLDPTFTTGTGFNDDVTGITVQNDGKIIVTGNFTTYNNTTYNKLIRLNPDGSVDAGFNIGTGFNTNGKTYDALITNDGKILVTGGFNLYNGVARQSIVCLNNDGSINTAFNNGMSIALDGAIFKSKLQPDGKIVIGGTFYNCHGVGRRQIARLNADGSLDLTFLSGITTGGTPAVYDLIILSSGKILIRGAFLNYGGLTYMDDGAILNPNGSPDRYFNNGNNIPVAMCMMEQPDGKIIFGSYPPITYNGQNYNAILRLNPDGTVDHSLNNYTIPNNTTIFCALQQRDGGILIGGSFPTYNNAKARYLARLNGDPIHYNLIRGKVYQDANQDCQKQPSEKPLSSVIIKAEPGPFYGNLLSTGNYTLKVDTGNTVYTLSQILNPLDQKRLVNQCASSHSVSLTGESKDTASFDFADSVRACPLLTVDIQSTRRRRCMRNITVINYSNLGAANAADVQIRVVFPQYVSPIASSPTWTSSNQKELVYTIGTLASGQTGKITITDSVSCGDESIRGLTQCTKAIITTSSGSCAPSNVTWDNSSISMEGLCINGEASFNLKNKGSGNMSDSSEYRIYRNDTLVYKANFKLISTNNLLLHYPAAGQTIRLEADQRPGHPGYSKPSYTIEACGALATNAVKGHVNSLPQDDEDFEIAISCMEIRDSYDPNDKQAVPSGWGAAHNIHPQDKIDFTIRFQNTGNDTAYTVKIIDTLDLGFDLHSFVPVASSHPYTWQVSGKGRPVLTFIFNNVNLPDSNKNKEKSIGFIKYSLKPLSSSSEGTVLQNAAAIYFDYNSPVITNTTIHTIHSAREQNLQLSSLPGTQKFNHVISFPSTLSKVYGNTSFKGNATSNSNIVPVYSSSDQSVATILGDMVSILHAGSTTLTVNYSENEFFNSGSATQLLTVNKAPLTIKAKDSTIVYGTSIPSSFKLLYTGFVNGENYSVIDLIPSMNTSASSSSSVGSYPITLSGGTDDNYTITLTNGTLTINKASLQITARDTTVTYGSVPGSFNVNYSGFVNGENKTVLDILPTTTSAASNTSNVGSYPIVLNGGSDNNYNLIKTNGQLTISKAPLQVTALDASTTYGSELSSYDLAYTGFVNNETKSILTIQPVAGTTTSLYTSPGTYPITFFSNGMDDNYQITTTNGTLTINKAILNISVQNVAILIGSSIPSFEILYDGFVQPHSTEVLDILPTASTSATSSSPVGSYPIILNGGSDDQYDFNYTNGTITIGLASSIEESKKQTEIKLSPNPVVSELYFYGIEEEATIVLYNSLGMFLKQQAIQGNSIDLDYLGSGLYLYEIIGKNGILTKGKIIKQ